MHLVEAVLLDRAVSCGAKAAHVKVEIFAEGIDAAHVLQHIGEVRQPLVFDEVARDDLYGLGQVAQSGVGARRRGAVRGVPLFHDCDFIEDVRGVFDEGDRDGGHLLRDRHGSLDGFVTHVTRDEDIVAARHIGNRKVPSPIRHSAQARVFERDARAGQGIVGAIQNPAANLMILREGRCCKNREQGERQTG